MIYYGKQESCTNKEEAVAEFKNIETVIECYQKTVISHTTDRRL